MDLTTPRRKERRLRHIYEGAGKAAGSYCYKPLKITQFEICDSWINTGKECLVAQLSYIDRQTGEVKKEVLWSESYTLISTIRGTEAGLPHYTKIIRKRDGYYYFAKLNEEEKNILFNI